MGAVSATAKTKSSATRRSGKARMAVLPGSLWEAAKPPPPDVANVRSRAASRAASAALVGLGVEVAALLADPVADQILGALELLRPGVAGDEARGLPDHVKLAIALDLADEDRLGDVMVRQHLRGATGQVLGFDTWQR